LADTVKLLSAPFNPHRLLRPGVPRDRTTFRTHNEDLLVSSDPDFHPTDVAEDGDRSSASSKRTLRSPANRS
jgi:hypothetical protein